MATYGGSLIVQGGRRYLDYSYSYGHNTYMINKNKQKQQQSNEM